MNSIQKLVIFGVMLAIGSGLAFGSANSGTDPHNYVKSSLDENDSPSEDGDQTDE